MPDKAFTEPGRVPAPLSRPEGKPPITLGADGGWMLELTRRPGGEFEFSHEQVGGNVRITG